MDLDQVDIQLDRWTYVGHENVFGLHRLLAATFRISLSADIPETEITVHVLSGGDEAGDIERAKVVFHRLTASLARQTKAWGDPDEAL